MIASQESRESATSTHIRNRIHPQCRLVNVPEGSAVVVSDVRPMRMSSHNSPFCRSSHLPPKQLYMLILVLSISNLMIERPYDATELRTIKPVLTQAYYHVA